MNNRRARREKLFRESEVIHGEYTLTSVDELKMARDLRDHIAAGNVVLKSIGDSEPLRARLTAFPNLVFVHMNGPRTEMGWPRDAWSVDRALLIIVLQGGATVGQDVVSAGQFALVSPGDTPIELSTSERHNDIIFISFGAHKLEGLPMTDRAVGCTVADIDVHNLRPLLAFVTTLCGLRPDINEDSGTLMSVSKSIVRSLAGFIIDADTDAWPLYHRALRVLESEYATLNLNTARVASFLSVSVRTLQSAFEARGETLNGTLRMIRARAAVANRDANSSVPASRIAERSGFGSESTMYRAIRTLAAAA